ncbi:MULTISPECIES: GGDEF domain-containing protein [unclassified Methylophaga]|jgi:diguanylate cyclase (GGDEF)-like protein|uniref:GGDEF domain-containing protein n=1 Tax=unclassified Methylophaga TaxID=2629249 RepID=UPI000C8C7DB3|nr:MULTISPECIES: diguanylate cyclase [unclassified Methylophaga]MAP26411.1 GGDEF domain-containing protein [Methylophaga sp.]|tara:strand:- start:8496 stop:9482 length:987 start_codon:yes stop_codon:yes gene_type:complete
MDTVDKLFNGSFMPHGHCLQWLPDLLFLHVSGDLLTSIAYFVIPIALVYLVKKRTDLAFNWIFIMFAAFIFLCGVTHLTGLINIWQGFYYIEGLAKFATGLVSILTAVMIWRLIPKALAIPSNDEFRNKNAALQQAQRELLESNQLLERRVLERTKELERLTTTDPLTGVMNRRGLIDNLTAETDRAERYHHHLSLLMVDMDHFKDVNDKFGHLSGDAVLIEVANILSDTCRTSDFLGRYGGEEFLLLLPETGTEEASQLAERIRAAIEQHRFCQDDGVDISLTCSIGVTEFRVNQTQTSLLQSVDRMLYSAKESGRNRVVVNDNSES